MLATTDGGRSWHSVPGAPPGGVAFADAKHGCAGYFGTRTASTTDGGRTWQPTDAGRGLVVCAANLLDPAWGVAAKPFDPGDLRTIGAIVGPTDAWALVSFPDTQRFGFEATSDAGSTWTAYRWPQAPDGVGGMVSDQLTRLSFVSTTTGWAFTLFGQLFETHDAGTSWQEVR